MSVYSAILGEYDDISLEEMLALPAYNNSGKSNSEGKQSIGQWLWSKMRILFDKVINLLQRAINFVRSIPQRIRDGKLGRAASRIKNEANRYKEANNDMKQEAAAKKKRAEDSKPIKTTIEIDGKEFEAEAYNDIPAKGDTKNGVKCLEDLMKATFHISSAGTVYEQTLLKDAKEENPAIERDLIEDMNTMDEDFENYDDKYAKAKASETDCKCALYEVSKLQVTMAQKLRQYKQQVVGLRNWYQTWVSNNGSRISQSLANRIASANAKCVGCVGKTSVLILGYEV